MAKNKQKKMLNNLVLWLVSVGALNWLLVSLLEFDLVMMITDAIGSPGVGTFLYSAIGAAGAWLGILVLMKKVTVK